MLLTPSIPKLFTQMLEIKDLISPLLLPHSILIGEQTNLVKLNIIYFKKIFNLIFFKLGCGVVDWNGNCAHERSNQFYTESINSDRFVARLCSGYLQIQNQNCPGIGTGIMGGDQAKSISGVFFLETNSNSPFARG